MQTVVECVPNFSEGRDPRVVDAIVAAILAGPDVYLLRREMDFDHHRSVVTFVGTRESIGEAALRAIGKAAELIDLNKHQGAHPRLGATDVVPFVPISGVTLADCVHIAKWVAEEAWRRFQIPTYLYEAAARKPERVHLENIRRGQFEGLRSDVANNPHRHPDFGRPALHPTAGATVVGARKFLIAYNINLNSPNLVPAEAIAKKIRASSGGFPCVKAMAVDLKVRNLAQVSINLTDFETTSMAKVYEAVELEAAALGLQVVDSEIVGLVPRKALEESSVHFLRIEDFHSELVIENCLEQVLGEQAAKSPGASSATTDQLAAQASLHALVEPFVSRVAAPIPTPAGGSVAALAAALAAALGEMVCGVSVKRKSLAAHHAALEAARVRLASMRDQLMASIDLDAQSYEALLQALKLPAESQANRSTRDQRVEEATKQATEVPLQTAELAARIAEEILSLSGITIPQAAADLSMALNLAGAARRGGVGSVEANLAGVYDAAWLKGIRARLDLLQILAANAR